jgi:hypothetical protein
VSCRAAHCALVFTVPSGGGSNGSTGRKCVPAIHSSSTVATLYCAQLRPHYLRSALDFTCLTLRAIPPSTTHQAGIQLRPRCSTHRHRRPALALAGGLLLRHRRRRRAAGALPHAAPRSALPVLPSDGWSPQPVTVHWRQQFGQSVLSLSLSLSLALARANARSYHGAAVLPMIWVSQQAGGLASRAVAAARVVPAERRGGRVQQAQPATVAHSPLRKPTRSPGVVRGQVRVLRPVTT